MGKKKKFLFKSVTAGAAAVLIASPFMVNASSALASTNGKTAENAIAWVKSKVGTPIDHDGRNGVQCVDLIKAYYAYLGQSQPYGNGADYVNIALPNGWKRYSKSQASPGKGDILIYTGGYGGYGHVAIYENDYSTYHQNWSSKAYVEQVTYKYDGDWDIKYWGFIRPDFVGGTPGTNTNVSVTGVKLNQTSASLAPGEKVTLTATVSPANATNKKVTWSSNNTGVAVVDSKGVVTAKGTGSATITVKTEDGSKTATAVISVKLPSNGLALTNGVWKYYVNGKLNTSYTGLAPNKNGWWYVNKGIVDYSFTGLAKSTNGKFYYARNGKWDTSYTGFAQYADGKWYFVRDGRQDKTYTGLAYNRSNGGWFYARNGVYDNTYTGLAKSTNGKFYNVLKGRWDTSYTGFAKYTDGKWYFVRDGRQDKTYTGLAYNRSNGGWFYARNGVYDNTYTGISKSTNGKLYYVKKGWWDTSYSGKANYNGKTYTVKQGRVV